MHLFHNILITPQSNIIQIIAILLILVGVLGFIKALIVLRKLLFGKQIYEKQLERPKNDFYISEEKTYTVWLKGKLLIKTPVAHLKPIIFDGTGRQLSLQKSFMYIHINGFEYGRMLLFTFKAKLGNYKLSFVEEFSIGIFQTALSKIVPDQKKNIKKFQCSN